MKNADANNDFHFHMFLRLSPLTMNDNNLLNVIFTVIFYFYVNWVKW